LLAVVRVGSACLASCLRPQESIARWHQQEYRFIDFNALHVARLVREEVGDSDSGSSDDDEDDDDGEGGNDNHHDRFRRAGNDAVGGATTR
jgi:hypothetical protein